MTGEEVVARGRTLTGEEVVARGRALIGVRFRPQGRCAETGVDCIGLAAIACGLPAGEVRGDYGSRESDPAGIEAGLAKSGLRRIAAGAAEAGDVLVVRAGFSQLHVVVLTPEGFLHADAGMRRVVEVPGAMGWPLVGAWRLREEDPDSAHLQASHSLPRAGEG